MRLLNCSGDWWHSELRSSSVPLRQDQLHVAQTQAEDVT